MKTIRADPIKLRLPRQPTQWQYQRPRVLALLQSCIPQLAFLLACLNSSWFLSGSHLLGLAAPVFQQAGDAFVEGVARLPSCRPDELVDRGNLQRHVGGTEEMRIAAGRN